jgi:glutamyl-tRNA synthetase
MPDRTPVTRFAPSPTGHLHLGNARTAFFSYLAARSGAGRFVLRIEDTDAGRSDPALTERLLDDLLWLGLAWDEGPDRGGPHASYLQSERAAIYTQAIAALTAAGRAYPCFCRPEELSLARRAQIAAGRPPRYPGTCASLPDEEVRRRRAAGETPALRFRVPMGRTISFDDRIHGPQHFSTDDIGDFVIARADGSAAFFLSNAVDDARMGVSLVLRGDDHLANTPRQLLLLEALELPAPDYGHLPLLLAPSGAPLSKREGVAGLRDLREQGYLPAAITNYLLRLGHSGAPDHWLAPAEMPQHLRLSMISRSAARFDETQLRHWQREAVNHASLPELVEWLGARLERLGDRARRERFAGVVRGNLLFPGDADALVGMIGAGDIGPGEEARELLAEAGPAFFESALSAWVDTGPDFGSWTRATAAATGRRGAGLFMPLRAALTGETHGPELAPLVELMGRELVTSRLRTAAARSRPARSRAD